MVAQMLTFDGREMAYGLLIKPVSGSCNLSCTYCFYRHQKQESPAQVMEQHILERLICDYLSDVPHAAFAWQGGEPTLAGLDFYAEVLRLEKMYKRPHQTVTNALQTNGILLSSEWGRFLAANDFLVGLSIDGRRQEHDRYRRNKSGHPSFDLVMRGLETLKAHKVEYNVLAVLTPESVASPWRLYAALRKYGTRYLQFIPLMESPEDADGTSLTLSPEAYGRFLCECFEYWYADLLTDKPISIRTFDNAVGLSVGVPSETCVFQKGCPMSPVIEADGSVYPCDFFVTPEWCMGNLTQTKLGDIVRGSVMQRFREQSIEVVDECRSCPILSLCNAGCMAERLFSKNTGKVSYYCESYKSFFSHAYPRLREVAKRCLGR